MKFVPSEYSYGFVDPSAQTSAQSIQGGSPLDDALTAGVQVAPISWRATYATPQQQAAIAAAQAQAEQQAAGASTKQTFYWVAGGVVGLTILGGLGLIGYRMTR